ncbi:hypothetical protein CYLTODRAFT_489796 [Cylindrobasidium torrendii FP15055 ss-10]|uniref:Uncharacterized protein n=1 Tax=Cylindrobasidium torrendii FP15055 ss-10 TaxID=1314674 RepID=A0A0D7BFN4_9AGAR|nr:hypothetical protein CYLTODRAFT_489796 [Cylindrobasidium torrendii FP15055 ss-10]
MDIDLTEYKRGKDDTLEFIRSLWNQKSATSEDIVTLKTNGKTNDRLFIFSEYIRTKDRVNKARDVDQGQMGAVVVVGSPGIGKTCWLEYMASLEARAGRPFLFYRANVFYLVRQDGVYIIGRQPIVSDLDLVESLVDPVYGDTVLFVDVDTGEVPSILPRLKPFIIQAASPQHSHYKWLKQRSGGRLFIMNPHPAHELQAALQLYMVPGTTFTEAEIATAVADHGPNMRGIQHALRSPGAALERLISDVGVLKPNVLLDIVSTVGGMKTTHDLIKTFSLVVRSNLDIDDDTELHAVANKHVWRRLMDSQLYKQYTHQVSRLFVQLSSVPQAETTAGWLFETMAQRHICEGKTVFLTPLEYEGDRLQPSAKDVKVAHNFPILKPSIFNTKDTTDHTRDEGTYYIPSAANNPTVDAFARPDGRGMAFQMTLSSKHSLNAGGLQMLRARLKDVDTSRGKVLFAFVVPYGRVEFSCPAPEKRVDRDFFDFVLLELPQFDNYAKLFALEQPEREDGPAALPPDVEMGDPQEE